MKTKLDEEILRKNGYKECYPNSLIRYFESPDNRVQINTGYYSKNEYWQVFIFEYTDVCKKNTLSLSDVCTMEQLNQLLCVYGIEELKI